MNRGSTCVALIGALVVSACGGGGGGEPPVPTLDSLAIQPASPAVQPGLTIQLAAQGMRYGNTREMTSTAVWTSDSPDVASVSGGVVTGVREGTAVITASVGKVKAEVPVVVRHALKAFMTPVAGTANFSTWPGAGGKTGLAAADAICQASAESAGLPGTFRALLGDSRDDAYCRAAGLSGQTFPTYCGTNQPFPTAGPWVRVDGFPFAPDLVHLSGYEVFVPILFDSSGKTIDGVAWRYDGGSSVCGDWTCSATACPSGTALRPVEIGSLDTRRGSYTLACSDSARLVCVEIGPSAPAPIPPSAGKVAFITSVTGSGKLSTWPDSGGKDGIAGADAVCQARAAAAGLANATRFKAWLADGTTGPLNRLTSDGPWVRVDGVPLARNRAELGSVPLFTTLDRSELGLRQDRFNAWTGTMDINTSHSTCAVWSNDSSELGTIGVGTSVSAWSTFNWNISCNNPEPLYCFED